MTRPAWRLLPHTADLMIEVRGSDEPSVIALSVEALFSQITDRRRVREREARTLRVAADTPEEALYLLLRKAFALFAVDRFLVRRARVRMEGTEWLATATGEPADVSRNAVYREIKAVTAHALSVRKSPAGFVARFVVDV